MQARSTKKLPKNWLRNLSAGVVAALIISPSMAKPFHHHFGELREYHRHWLAVCPDEVDLSSNEEYKRECWASTFTGIDGRVSGDFPGDRFSVARDRGNGKFKLTFVSVSEDEVDRSRRIGFTFSSGEQDDYVFGDRITTNGNVINEFTFTHAEDTTIMLYRMRRGTHMQVTIPLKSGGEKVSSFSLRGLRNAMKFLEEYAQR